VHFWREFGDAGHPVVEADAFREFGFANMQTVCHSKPRAVCEHGTAEGQV
jgi:hypothetical protein